MRKFDLKEPNNAISDSLGYFNDVDTLLEGKQRILSLCENGFIHTLENDINLLEEFLDSKYDLIEVRDFVELQINWAIGDPTGEAQLQWIRDVLVLMKSTLEEIRESSSRMVTEQPLR